jgi:Zn ribbon nucleic-acid-binding protein
MEFKKCNRCGGFFASEGNVCPKCSPKDTLELSTFKNYIEENGISSVESMSVGTGISAKNINRFINIEGINYTTEGNEKTVGNNGVTLN